MPRSQLVTPQHGVARREIRALNVEKTESWGIRTGEGKRKLLRRGKTLGEVLAEVVIIRVKY